MGTGSRVRLCVVLTAELMLASGAWAQAPIRRIRQKMTDSLGMTPDFACMETLEQSLKVGSTASVKLAPFQVQTGVINGKEVHAWPADEAERKRLREILALYDEAGTNSFAAYSRAVFLTAGATFYDGPEETKDGRTLSRVDFTMPREVSTYSLSKTGNPTLSYSGSIWYDPATLDVVRMTLHPEQIPADSGLKSISQTFEFGHARMAGSTMSASTVVVPTSMELIVNETSGREHRLTGRFSDCRQYLPKRGEQFVSTAGAEPEGVSAAAPAPKTAAASPAPVVPAKPAEGPWLPGKLVLQTILIDAIDERHMTQGSTLSLTVLHDVKKSGKVIVPKGATVLGHITRIIQQEYVIYSAIKRYYLVGIELDSVIAGEQRYRVHGNLESLGPAPPPPTESVGFIPYSHSPEKWGTFEDIRGLFIVPSVDYAESFLGIVREFLRLPDHMLMFWTTMEAKP